MRLDLIKRDLIALDWLVEDQSDFFDRMVGVLMAGNYVRDTFREALGTRESTYPTALPTSPEAVAIPHSDAEHVITPFIAPVRLHTPVTWHEMGNDSVTHPVRFIFMLGFTDESGHVEVLQILLQNLQDPSFMERLDQARTEDEYYDVLSAMSGLEA